MRTVMTQKEKIGILKEARANEWRAGRICGRLLDAENDVLRERIKANSLSEQEIGRCHEARVEQELDQWIKTPVKGYTAEFHHTTDANGKTVKHLNGSGGYGKKALANREPQPLNLATVSEERHKEIILHVKPKRLRGFAAMSPELHKKLSVLGGRAVSVNREYMSRIGTIGGGS